MTVMMQLLPRIRKKVLFGHFTTFQLRSSWSWLLIIDPCSSATYLAWYHCSVIGACAVKGINFRCMAVLLLCC